MQKSQCIYSYINYFFDHWNYKYVNGIFLLYFEIYIYMSCIFYKSKNKVVCNACNLHISDFYMGISQ